MRRASSLIDLIADSSRSRSASIKLLLAFANWECWELASDTMRSDVLPLLYQVGGRPATSDRLWALHKRLARVLSSRVEGHRAHAIDLGSIHSVRALNGRLQTVVADNDLNDHFAVAVQALIKSRWAVRRCVVCPSFFVRPRPKQRTCSTECKNAPGEVARRMALGAQRTRKSRAAELETRRAERRRLPLVCQRLELRYRAAEDRDDHAEATRCLKALTKVEKRIKQLDTRVRRTSAVESRTPQIIVGTPGSPAGPDPILHSPLPVGVRTESRSIH